MARCIVCVPRLSEFYGIVIYMYFADHNPPHFHAIYAEYEALIRIDNGSTMRGKIPRTALGLVSNGERCTTTNFSPTGRSLRNLPLYQGSNLCSRLWLCELSLELPTLSLLVAARFA